VTRGEPKESLEVAIERLLQINWKVLTLQFERQSKFLEGRSAVEDELRQGPEPLANAVELRLGVEQPDFHPLVDILVEVFEEGAQGVDKSDADLLVHPGLQGAEGGVDGFGHSALLVDREDSLLEIDHRFDGA